MRIGIGLPSTVPGVERAQLLDWARGAEQRGFAALGTIDRLVYPCWDPLVALAAAAAVTERIELLTSILIAPYRNTAVLAKQAASLDQLSGGRLVLGVALGGREDDYEASGMEGKRTGARLEQQLDEMKRIWGGEKRGFAGAIGPSPVRAEGPSLIVGGSVPAAFERAARFADGWIMGGGAPDQFAQAAAAVRDAWQRVGGGGEPRLMALAYFGLGDGARGRADDYIHDYYGIAGDELAGQIASSVAVSPEMVERYVGAFDEAGCDDLVLFPASSDPGQVGLLADACGL